MSEGPPSPKRLRLENDEIVKMSKEELIEKLREMDDYVSYLHAKQRGSVDKDEGEDKEGDEKSKHPGQDSSRRENTLVLRLTNKEQELQDCMNQIAEMKASQSQNSAQLRSLLMDPAVNLVFQRMAREMEDSKEKLKQSQNELSAWKFTADSQMGKRLMAKCRMLLQENEELGKMITTGRTSKLEAEINMQKRLVTEMKKNQDEMNEFVSELEEDVEGMQSMIYVLQQQLKDTKENVAVLELENSRLRALENTSHPPPPPPPPALPPQPQQPTQESANTNTSAAAAAATNPGTNSSTHGISAAVVDSVSDGGGGGGTCKDDGCSSQSTHTPNSSSSNNGTDTAVADEGTAMTAKGPGGAATTMRTAAVSGGEVGKVRTPDPPSSLPHLPVHHHHHPSSTPSHPNTPLSHLSPSSNTTPQQMGTCKTDNAPLPSPSSPPSTAPGVTGFPRTSGKVGGDGGGGGGGDDDIDGTQQHLHPHHPTPPLHLLSPSHPHPSPSSLHPHRNLVHHNNNSQQQQQQQQPNGKSESDMETGEGREEEREGGCSPAAAPGEDNCEDKGQTTGAREGDYLPLKSSSQGSVVRDWRPQEGGEDQREGGTRTAGVTSPPLLLRNGGMEEVTATTATD